MQLTETVSAHEGVPYGRMKCSRRRTSPEIGRTKDAGLVVRGLLPDSDLSAYNGPSSAVPPRSLLIPKGIAACDRIK